jgi:CheY-like chemotaxis protein
MKAEHTIPDVGSNWRPFSPSYAGESAVQALHGIVLLAEDDPPSQRLFATILRSAGAEVLVASNGQEAIDLAMSATGSARPIDMTLMDIDMPVIDGVQAIDRLRAAGLRQPIVVCTAAVDDELRQRCFAAGCDAIVTKPISRQRLIDTARQWLTRW